MKVVGPTLLTIALLCCFCGCSRKYQGPAIPSGELLSPAAKSEILTRFAARSAEIVSARILSRTRINSGKQKTSLRHTFIFSAPDKYKLEALPLNSAYAMQVFVLNGGDTLLLEPSERRTSRGKADGTQLKKILGIPLKERELPYFLLGRLPSALLERVRNENFSKLYFDGSKRSYTLVVGDYEYLIRLDAQNLLITDIEYRDVFAQRLQGKLVLDELIKQDNTEIFRHITITLAREDVQVDLRITSAALNGEVSADLFEMLD